MFPAITVFTQLILVTVCSMTYTTTSRTLALELREPSQAGCVWVRSAKIGSTLECGVLPSFSLPALSHKHLLALYSLTLCRIRREEPPESCTLKKNNCCNKLLISRKRDEISGRLRTDRKTVTSIPDLPIFLTH